MKRDALQRIAAEGFWQAVDCYQVLGRAEFMDRIEAALRTADSLGRRLQGREEKPKSSYSRKIMTRLAEQVYLLAEAEKSLGRNLPKDAYLMIESRGGHIQDTGPAGRFMEQLLKMYCQWARKRRMRHMILQNPEPTRSPANPVILAVSGLGSYAVLEPESGLHVLEIPKGANAYDRINLRVAVAGQREAPVHTREDHLKQAAERFAAVEASTVVVRRYREAPSPLVRDAIRNYRTGRIDKVLDGDFDLFG